MAGLARLQKSGAWTRAGFVKAFQKASEEASRQAIDLAMNRISDKAIRTIKWHIMKQDLGWKPLSRDWKRKKNTDMAWIWTGSIFNNIESDAKHKGGLKGKKIFTVNIGIKKGVKHPTTGADLSLIAAANEAKRPLIAPSLKEVEAWQGSGINNPITLYHKLMKEKGFDLQRK